MQTQIRLLYYMYLLFHLHHLTKCPKVWPLCLILGGLQQRSSSRQIVQTQIRAALLFAIPFASFWPNAQRFGLFVWFLGRLQQRFMGVQKLRNFTVSLCFEFFVILVISHFGFEGRTLFWLHQFLVIIAYLLLFMRKCKYSKYKHILENRQR